MYLNDPPGEPPENTYAQHASRGSVAVFLGLMLAVLIGIAALGTEVVYAMVRERQMQATASAAAVSAALALTTLHPADPIAEARAIAATSGFTNGTGGTTVTVNIPPLRGPYAGIAKAVEVIVGQPQTLPLSGLFFVGPWNINARAVALAGNNGGACALALDTGSATGVAISNGASINLNQCGLAVDSTGPNALTVVGGAVLTTNKVTVSGGVSVSNGGSISVVPDTGQAAVGNPYSAAQIPAWSGCAYGSAGNPYQVQGWQNPTLSPGVYCGGIAMSGGGTVKMNPGIYIINGGTFSPQGGVTLTGTGVTIVLTGSGSDYANVSIANGVNVTLTAPTTGPTAGLVFFQDAKAPTSGISSFQGGASLILTGALYFPTQTVNYANGTTTASTCTQLVAWHIQFAGGASFNSNCANAGTQPIGASPSRLVE
jgi:hypothetical protein